MPENQFITSIPGVQIEGVEYCEQIKIRGVALRNETTVCPKCQSAALRIKCTRERVLRHGTWGRRVVVLKVKIPKLLCKVCDRYFMLPIPGLLPKKRATEQFRQEVYHLHQEGISQINLSKSHGISGATVERWFHDFVEYRVKELEGRDCPLVLGIDEHFFSRKDGFATTLVDLRNHKVFDVVLGRSEKSLGGYLSKLRGRERVRVVVMDLSETYRAIVQMYFPNAKIVADRFHVVRLLNQQFLKVWSTLDPQGRKNRGLLSLMRRHESNLKPEQRPKLEAYFQKVQGLEELYRFKQDLMELLLKKHQKRTEVQQLIPKLMWHLEALLASPWEPLKTFGQTLKSWLEPVARMWRFTKNNGITEGFHTKMEMIARRAFGFRNFRNYRLRVVALCGWDGIFAIRN